MPSRESQVLIMFEILMLQDNYNIVKTIAMCHGSLRVQSIPDLQEIKEETL